MSQARILEWRTMKQILAQDTLNQPTNHAEKSNSLVETEFSAIAQGYFTAKKNKFLGALSGLAI